MGAQCKFCMGMRCPKKQGGCRTHVRCKSALQVRSGKAQCQFSLQCVNVHCFCTAALRTCTAHEHSQLQSCIAHFAMPTTTGHCTARMHFSVTLVHRPFQLHVSIAHWHYQCSSAHGQTKEQQCSPKACEETYFRGKTMNNLDIASLRADPTTRVGRVTLPETLS